MIRCDYRCPALISIIQTNRGRDQDQRPLQEEGSPRRVSLSMSGASRPATPFLKISTFLSAWIPCTFVEVVATVSKEDLTYLHNLFVADKMELLYVVTFNVYREAFLFSRVFVDWCDVLGMGNPSNKIDTWKGKCEAIWICSKF